MRDEVDTSPTYGQEFEQQALGDMKDREAWSAMNHAWLQRNDLATKTTTNRATKRKQTRLLFQKLQLSGRQHPKRTRGGALPAEGYGWWGGAQRAIEQDGTDWMFHRTIRTFVPFACSTYSGNNLQF